jgi:hypothetical protein
MDNEYQSFLAELGGNPADAAGRDGRQPGPPPGMPGGAPPFGERGQRPTGFTNGPPKEGLGFAGPPRDNRCAKSVQKLP